MLEPRRERMRRTAILRRRRYTGPSAKVRRIVRDRAGSVCEWPACQRIGVEYHHRLNRKIGGRHGARQEEINQPSWIVLACRDHHQRVTSPSGQELDDARDMGWLLREGETAREVPVAMDGGAYLLDDDGGRELIP